MLIIITLWKRGIHHDRKKVQQWLCAGYSTHYFFRSYNWRKKKLLDEYHDKDIAEAFELLPKEERKLFFDYFDIKRLSSIIGYIEDPEDYIQDFGYKKYAMLINKMDLDDAVDILENLNENTKSRLLPYLHVKRREDIFFNQIV